MRILIAVLMSLSLSAHAHAQSGSSGDTPSPSQAKPQEQSQALSNAEALRVISREWNDLVGWLLISERLVAANTPPADCKSEAISPPQFDFLLNAERAGLVTIRYWDDRGAFLKEKDYTNREIIEFAVNGRLQKMTIIPTKLAQKEQVKLEVHSRTGCMSFKVGDYKIEHVTENRSLRKGAIELAAVNVTYSVDYRPIYKQVYSAGKVKIDSKRKANVLLRFDAAGKRWRIIAFDAANIGEDIKPVNIPAVYDKL